MFTFGPKSDRCCLSTYSTDTRRGIERLHLITKEPKKAIAIIFVLASH